MEAHWSQRAAIPANLLLAHLRPDLSAAQHKVLLHHNAAYLGLSRCSFGLRGQMASAVRSEAEVRRLMALCKIARTCTRGMFCERAIRCPKGSSTGNHRTAPVASAAFWQSDLGQVNICGSSMLS
jgi:hypothetical protein